MSELLEDLPTAHLEYAMRGERVGDWLVLGPLLASLADAKVADAKVAEANDVQSSSARRHWLGAHLGDVEEICQPPAERDGTGARPLQSANLNLT